MGSGTGPATELSSQRWRSVDANADRAAAYLKMAGDALAGFKRQTNERLELAPGMRVLEVGCGLGHDSEAMARLVGPGGEVVGTDISVTFVDGANARCAPLGLPLRFEVADVTALSYADDSFDAARIERTLQHLQAPERAVAELVRVVRPGGRIVAFEPDWDTMVFSAGDREVTRAYRTYATDRRYAQGDIARRVPALMRAAGCASVTCEGVCLTLSQFVTADYATGAGGTLQQMVAAGLLEQASVTEWWRAQEEADANGCFVFTVTATITRGIVGG